MIKGGKWMRKFAVVIPAYHPKDILPQYVDRLIQHGVEQVIVVDDGNEASYDELFHQLTQFERCTVLEHEYNSGKGAALKTGFNHFLTHDLDLTGVVTADADGQHLIEDVLKVGDRIEQNREGFVLGTREFQRKDMPTRSFIGNTVTSRVFQGLFGMYIKDTQTGLRGIATAELNWVVQLKGNHFDFEMMMLINMIKKDKRIVRVDVEAIYHDVHISHFATYKDSVRVARQMFREYISYLQDL